MISRFVDKYEIPIDAAANLIKYNARLDLNKYSENPVYIWLRMALQILLVKRIYVILLDQVLING